LWLGHPGKTEVAQEMGKVRKLLLKQGELFALAEVGQTLLDLVRAGRYKKVSAGFRRVGNVLRLDHVAFLGAHPPAVKSMAPLSFGEPATSAPVACLIGEPLNFSSPHPGSDARAIAELIQTYQQAGLGYWQAWSLATQTDQ